MAPSNNGGSIPLPRICGFDERFFLGHKPTLEDRHKMSSMLGSKRFQRGNRAARCYANLVVLFRLLLFHSPLRHDARFWGWIATDWGIVDGNRDLVSEIANFYSDARYAALGTNEKRLSLLVRLVDEWLMIRPRPEISFSETIEDATIHAIRSAWFNIRDHHVDMLMDAKLPARLAGVEPPAKIVTSLWETDPEVIAFLKEVNTSRGPRRSVDKFKPTQSTRAQPKPTGSEVERKRKVSLSEGKIDKAEPTPASNDSAVDQGSLTPHLEDGDHGLTFSMRPDHPHKRNQVVQGGRVSETFPANSGDTFGSLDFTLAARRPPLLSYEQFQQRVLSSKPSQPRDPAEQPSTNSASGSLQSTVSQWTSDGHSGKTHSAVPDQREELTAQLRRAADQTKRRREELRARGEMETTGYVPIPSNTDGCDSPVVGLGGVGLMASEREMYESRLQKMEDKIAALERAHQHEPSWARAMGQFLYDANAKSVKALQDVSSAIDTLQATSLALLDKPQKPEE